MLILSVVDLKGEFIALKGALISYSIVLLRQILARLNKNEVSTSVTAQLTSFNSIGAGACVHA